MYINRLSILAIALSSLICGGIAYAEPAKLEICAACMGKMDQEPDLPTSRLLPVHRPHTWRKRYLRIWMAQDDVWEYLSCAM